MNDRIRRPWSLFAGASLLALVCGVSGQSVTPEPLAPGSQVHTLSGGQSQSYVVTLGAGEFVEIKFGIIDVIVAVTITDPAGRTIANSMLSSIDVYSASGGRYVVRVHCDDAGAPAGRYRIDAGAPHVASAREQTLASAHLAFNEAFMLGAQNTAATHRSAAARFGDARELFRTAGDRAGELWALIQMGDATSRIPDGLTTGRQMLMDAARMAREAGETFLEGHALNTLGTTYSAQPDRPKALECYEAAATLFEKAGEVRRQGMALGNMGNALNDVSEPARAREVFDRAAGVASSINDRQQLARIYNGMGLSYEALGDLPAALDHLLRAQQLSRSSGNSALESMAVNNAGIVYKNLGDYPKALDAYEQSLAFARRRGDASSEAQLLLNIGNVHNSDGRPAKALEYYAQVLAMARRQNNRTLEAVALNNAGSSSIETGDYATAVDDLNRSLVIRRAIGDRRGEGSTLLSLGRASHRRGDLTSADRFLAASLDIRRSMDDPLGEAEVLLEIATVQRDRGDLTRARSTSDSALAIIESQRAKIQDAGLRASYVARVHDTYEVNADVLMQLHRRSPGDGYDALALQAAERARARVLLEKLAGTRADIREGVDAALLDRDRTLQSQLEAASSRLSRALGRASTPQEIAAARKDVEQLTSASQQLQVEIRKSSPRYGALTQPEPLSASEIQKDVLDPNTVLLEFSLGEERSWLWAVTPDRIASVEIAPRKTIEDAARAFYASLTARQPRNGEARIAYTARVAAADRRIGADAAALSQLLFGGVAGDLRGAWRGKRLAIVATGALEYLPFASLPMPIASPAAAITTASLRQRFIDAHEIVGIPSASVLATLRRDRAERGRPGRGVAIFADPVFEADDPRVATKVALRANAADAVQPASTSASTEARLKEAADRPRLSRLPFSREEASAIATLAGSQGTLAAMDFKASRALTTGSSLEQYRILHFATHGLIDSEHAELSGLVLSLFDQQGAPQNGLLRLPDIFNMRLNADLVVLSACQTALGKEIRGEGLVGLTRGFMYAGTSRVVASLWEVNDLATAELMKKFYAGLLQRRLTASAALRAAQRELARDPRWSSPYFWAGFVIQGDWR